MSRGATQHQRAHGVEDVSAPRQRVHRRDPGGTGIDGEQVANVGRVRLELAHPAHAVLDLGDDLGLAIELFDPEIPPELIGQRQEGNRLAERDALSLEPGDLLAGLGQRAPEFEEQPRLSDPGIAHEGHHLAAAVLDLGETVEQRLQLALAADERCEAALGGDVQA